MKKELLFSGGGGAMAFQFGMANEIVNLIGKNKLKQYQLGGVSSGSCIAFSLHICLHSNLSMRDIYQKVGREIYQDQNKHNIFRLKENNLNAILENAYDLINNIDNNQIQNVHCAVSIVNKYKLQAKIHDNYESKKQFVQAIRSSCHLPLLIGNQIFQEYNGLLAIDGGFTKPIPYKFDDSYKVFIDIIPVLTQIQLILSGQPKNLNSFTVDNKTLSFGDFLFRDLQHADNLFEKGINYVKLRHNCFQNLIY